MFAVLFKVTKNAGQALAVWRMVQRLAFSTASEGMASQVTNFSSAKCSRNVALSDQPDILQI